MTILLKPLGMSRFRLLFSNLKSDLRGRNFGSNEGVIDAFDEYLGDQEESFYFKGISDWNSIGESASRQRDIILFSALGHSQSTEAENF